jgi:amino acid transporter
VKAGIIIGLIEIAVFLALALTFIFKAGSHNTLSAFGTGFSDVKGYAGFSGVFAGSVYAITAFVGFEAAAPLAEEAHEPRKTIGRAALLSALGIGVFFAFVTYAATVYFGPHRMATFGSYGNGNPYQQLARDVWGGGWVLIFLALLNSSLAVCNAGANATTRTWYAMGRIRLLPAALGRVDEKTRAPRNAIWLQLVFTLVVTFWLALQYNPSTAIGILGALEGMIAMIIFIVINLSCIGFYVKRREEFNPLIHLVAPLIGVAFFVPAFFTVAGITVFKFVSPLPAPISYARTAVLIWLGLGVGYLAYLYMKHPERLLETKRVFIDDGAQGATPEPASDGALLTAYAGETLP